MSAPRGPVLALDASTAIGSVAVGRGEELLAEVVLRVGPGHSSALLPAIDQALRWAEVSPGELEGVVVAGGPGSFTGLRIAAATAKGIVHARELPLWAYSGLLMLAAGAAAVDRPACALLDARRRDVYAGAYRFGSGVEEVLAPTALSLDALVDHFQGEPPLFVGEGALLHRAELEERVGARIAPSHLALPRASTLLWLLRTAPGMGEVPDPLAWEPEYLRASGAERIAAESSAGAGR